MGYFGALRVAGARGRNEGTVERKDTAIAAVLITVCPSEKL